MVELSLGVLFRGFNASKFILYSCLLTFVVLISLKLDEKINFNYAFVFAPLWACNALVFIGAIVGACSFCSKPPSRNEIMMRVDFTAMIITAIEHIFLCLFITLTYVKLEFEHLFQPTYPLPWTIVFCPLFSLSILSIGIAVWSLRHDKPFEFEFFYAINIVELVFISFKLDKQVDWTWAVVFIPLWVVLSLSAVGVLYALVLSIVLVRSRHFIPAHRRQHVYSAILHTFLVIPALVCLVLLTGKLGSMQWNDDDGAADLSYTVVFTPLVISLFFMTFMALGFGGAPPNGAPVTNVWWFGLRQPLCPFLLEKCPSLRTYANVSYRLGSRRRTDNQAAVGEERQAVIETGNEENDETDRSERNGRRQRRINEKKKNTGKSAGGKGNATSQADQNGQDIVASSAAITRAMLQYKSEFGHMWVGDIGQPD